MSALSHREQIELRLKHELQEAEHQMRHATAYEMADAKRHYHQILRAFTRLVMDGGLPQE